MTSKWPMEFVKIAVSKCKQTKNWNLLMITLKGKKHYDHWPHVWGLIYKTTKMRLVKIFFFVEKSTNDYNLKAESRIMIKFE